jgi:hypothetical protein
VEIFIACPAHPSWSAWKEPDGRQLLRHVNSFASYHPRGWSEAMSAVMITVTDDRHIARVDLCTVHSRSAGSTSLDVEVLRQSNPGQTKVDGV